MTTTITTTEPFSSGDAPPQPRGSQPLIHQRGAEVQQFGTVRLLPIALSYEARMESCQLLNQILADSMILYSHYKKHHWLMRGHTFYQLHLLLDKHAGEQLELIDMIAERIQTLGGIAIADPRHIAEVTNIPRPPNGAEEVPVMLSRLLGRTSSSSVRCATRSLRPRSTVTTEATTCSWATSCAATSCRSGSSPNTSSTPPSRGPILTRRSQL